MKEFLSHKLKLKESLEDTLRKKNENSEEFQGFYSQKIREGILSVVSGGLPGKNFEGISRKISEDFLKGVLKKKKRKKTEEIYDVFYE